MSDTSDSRKPPEGYTAHLIRLVQACGDTLKNHAAEIVGTKSGTTSFQIVFTLPKIDERGAVFPDMKVIQTYVSDEALKVEMARAYGDLPAVHVPAPDDAEPGATSVPNTSRCKHCIWWSSEGHCQLAFVGYTLPTKERCRYEPCTGGADND